MGTYAVQNGYMASRTLTLGDISSNYGGGSNWNANTAALVFECADNTEIAVHDSGTRIASLMYFEGASLNRITIGRDMGWGTIGQVLMNGNVAIGGPAAVNGLTVWNGLRVNGIEFGPHTYGGGAGLYPSQGYGGTKPIAPHNTSFSAYFAWTIRAPAYLAFSDERIKSNIVDIHDATALDQLRQLQPKYYEYVDKVGKGSSTVIGFIAQEVKTVVPQAVSVADGDITNIYETANVSANILTFTNFYTSNLDATSNTLIVYEEGTKRKDLTIVEVVDEHTIRVDTDVAGEDVFVYGQVVQDFHHLNKDYLWTVATSALQEVDRQLQQEKVRNDRLEARLQALETKL